jgi:hypothetical protein
MPGGSAVLRSINADPIVLLGGAVRESGRLVAEHLGHRAALPRDASRVGAEFMTRALQGSCPGVRVRAVEQVGRFSGTTDRATLTLEYDGDGLGAELPRRVFVKTAPPDGGTRIFINLVRLGTNEVRFYREIGPSLEVERPAAHFAEVSGAAQRFVLVLEDVTLRGGRPCQVADQLTLDQARHVVAELARLHAPFWASPRLTRDLGWLRRPGAGSSVISVFERALPAMALGAALRKYADLVPVEVAAAGHRIVGARRRLEQAWAVGPLTVIHGDAHAGNLYSLKGAMGLLDWQLVQVGQGMRDVAYFITTSLETELRRGSEAELISLYRASLAAHGVAPPSREDAWQQYRLHALYAWQAAMFTAAVGGLQAAASAIAGFRRTSAALVDLGSLDALEELLGCAGGRSARG